MNDIQQSYIQQAHGRYNLGTVSSLTVSVVKLWLSYGTLNKPS